MLDGFYDLTFALPGEKDDFLLSFSCCCSSIFEKVFLIYSSHYFCTFFVAQKKQINHFMKNSGSGKSKNPSWSKSPIKLSLLRFEIKKLLRILDP